MLQWPSLALYPPVLLIFIEREDVRCKAAPREPDISDRSTSGSIGPMKCLLGSQEAPSRGRRAGPGRDIAHSQSVETYSRPAANA